jgi:hypothetical protein
METSNMTKAKRPTTRLNRTSRLLTTSERRAFIWESPRLREQQGAFYYILVNVPRDAMEDELTRAVERHGVKAAFEQLYGHTHIERTSHGFWVVGSPDDGTLMAFDSIERAAGYAHYLHDFYLAEDTGLCPGCGESMAEEQAQEATTNPTPKLKLFPKKLPQPPSTTH